MTKSAIALLLTLLAGGLAGYLQPEQAASRRASPQIDSVALSQSGGGARLQVSGSQSEDCAAPLRTTLRAFPQNLDIQLYQDIAATAVCGLQAMPFEIELSLDAAADASAVIINDQLWLAESDAYVETSLVPALIDQATLLQTGGEGLQLRLRGSQAVGCPLPELFSWRVTGDAVLLGVYNAMETATVCPDALIEIDDNLRLPATSQPVATLLRVNGILISELETQTVSDIDKVLTNIFQVDVTAAGERISLAVAGEHPDGCDFPVLVDQSRDGNKIYVEVYREVPADVFCPMILQPYQGSVQIEGSFAAGEYTIQVNSHSQTVTI